MGRLTKLDRMTTEEKNSALERFRDSSNEQFFPPEIIALVFDVSESWLQKMRTLGGGIPFSKPEGMRRIRYKKQDVLEYFEQSKRQSTSIA